MKKTDFNINNLIESIFLLDERDIRVMRELMEAPAVQQLGGSICSLVHIFSNEALRKLLESGIDSENAVLESLQKLMKYDIIAPVVQRKKDYKLDKDEAAEFNVLLFLTLALHDYSFKVDMVRLMLILNQVKKLNEINSSYTLALAIGLKYALEGEWVRFNGNQYQSAFDFGLEANPKSVLPYLTTSSQHTAEKVIWKYRPTLLGYRHIAEWFMIRDLLEQRTRPKRRFFFSKKENRITGVSSTTNIGTFWLPAPYRHHHVLHALNSGKALDFIFDAYRRHRTKHPLTGGAASGFQLDDHTRLDWRHDVNTSMQGFITADGQVADRKRAALIASYYKQTFVKQGVVLYDLYSENVWEGYSPSEDPEENLKKLKLYALDNELKKLIEDYSDKRCNACMVPRRTRYTLLRHTHEQERCNYNFPEL